MKKCRKMLLGMGMIVAMTGALIGCGADEPAVDLTEDYRMKEEVQVNLYTDGTLALSDFGVRLMRECFEADKNVLISPVSVISALGMTANGAEGDSLAQMEDVFRMDIHALNIFLKEYRESLPSDEKYRMNLANGIWFRDCGEFSVSEGFLQVNADYYNAGLYKAPFDENTAKEINDWVKKNTDDMIPEILDEIPPEAIMYLVNALAFEGESQNIYN